MFGDFLTLLQGNMQGAEQWLVGVTPVALPIYQPKHGKWIDGIMIA